METSNLKPSSASPVAEEPAQVHLQTKPHAGLKTVTCTRCNGVLVLQGRVKTYYLKQLAQTAAARLQGTERVDNRIEVITSAPVQAGTDAGGGSQADGTSAGALTQPTASDGTKHVPMAEAYPPK